MNFYHLFYTAALVSSGILISSSETAAMTFTYAAPSLSFAHTHTSTPSTKSAPFSKLEYKLAGVCFIGFGACADDAYFNKSPDGGSGGDFDVDTKKQCLNEGFTLTSCPAGSAASGICPYDNRYFQKCVSYKELCEQENYYKTCSGNMVLDPSQSCEYDSSYKKCEPKDELCESKGYFATCEDGKIQDPGQVCSYDVSYKKCVCNPCEGYNYSYAEASVKGYEPDGDACNSCGVMKYKRKAKECLGFLPCECGGEVGAPECWSADNQMFTTCKRCSCASGTMDIESYWCNGNFKCLFGGR